MRHRVERVGWNAVFCCSLFIVFAAILETIHGSAVRNAYYEAYLHHRRKRATNCAEKYATVTQGHSACLAPSSSLKNSGISDADKRLIVDTHNQVRREVDAASNMREITWDDEVANTAQRWADHCRNTHDSSYKRYAYGRFSVGQNLSWGSWSMGWADAIKLWSNEVKSFMYGRSNDMAIVGHYTQMVWAETSKIGCGYADCDTMHYYVCNYGPAGNSDITKPYKYGSTCSDCPSTCNNKLCDCRGKICLNGGTMDVNTCQCSCKKDLKFYIQPECGLNCTGIADPSWCRQYRASYCSTYTNVPQECPDMCKLCPTAGMGYGTTSRATKQDRTSAVLSSRTPKYAPVQTHPSSRTSNYPAVQPHKPSRTSNYPPVQPHQASWTSKYSDVQPHQPRRPPVQPHQTSRTSKYQSLNTQEARRTSRFHPTHAAVDCAEKYRAVISGHSACLRRSQEVNDAGISEKDKVLILDTHNKVRRDVYSASNMRELTWDDEIAKTAQRWAEHCQIGPETNYKRYSYGRFPVGEILAWDSRTMDWLVVINRWASGGKYFSYGRKNNVGVVGKYTQMVWAETSKIGCGYANCNGMHYYVCNYGPAGNLDINKPFIYGPTCGDCPATCHNKLCDCRGRVCLNGGTMNLNTCQCTCNKDLKFYIQPDCGLNCTGIQDPAWCRQYGVTACERYANVPVSCPDMCKWCPAASVIERNGHRTTPATGWPDQEFKRPIVVKTDKQYKPKQEPVDTHNTGSEPGHKYVFVKQESGRKTYEKAPNCSVKYATITVGHSACLLPSKNVKRAGVSEIERSLIVDAHNQIRRDVHSAQDMQQMTWDPEIATTAQRWAESCRVQGDRPYQRFAYGRFAVGQNLIWNTDDMGWVAVIGRWSSQVKRFQYAQLDDTAALGYSQELSSVYLILSAKTSKIGCGYADCGNMHYYVCNYGPAGKIDISRPYRSGPVCQDCPSTCSDRLCDCGGRVCLNGGTMDPETCRCKCNMGLKFYTQPDCTLNCTGIEDPHWCEKEYDAADCEKFVNIPQECPKMCGWCPAAGTEYPEIRAASGARTLGQSTTTVLVLYFLLLLTFV